MNGGSRMNHLLKPIAYSPEKCRYCGEEYNRYNYLSRGFHESGECTKQVAKQTNNGCSGYFDFTSMLMEAKVVEPKTNKMAQVS